MEGMEGRLRPHRNKKVDNVLVNNFFGYGHRIDFDRVRVTLVLDACVAGFRLAE